MISQNAASSSTADGQSCLGYEFYTEVEVHQEYVPIEKTLAMAKQFYAGRQSVGCRTLEDHCNRVARAAQTIAKKLFADVKPNTFADDTQTQIMSVAHAGLLHAAISSGACAFEDIAEQTTVQIADMVANNTRDYRLIETKRDIEYRGRISQSSIASQLVALADIICTVKEVKDTVEKSGLASVLRPRKILIRLDADLFSLHAASRYYVLRCYTHAAKNLIAETGQLLKDKKQQVRDIKAKKALTKVVQKSLAAKRRLIVDDSNSQEAE
jgi:hypothetical protein